jgi:hypothetical protein
VSDRGNIKLENEKASTTMVDFISSAHSLDSMLSFVEKRAAMYKKKGYATKKSIDKIESEYHAHLKQFNKDTLLPNMILAFNSAKRILRTPGYPALYKEAAEIIECGPLNSYKFLVSDYFNCLLRFSNIEQRWGL